MHIHIELPTYLTLSFHLQFSIMYVLCSCFMLYCQFINVLINRNVRYHKISCKTYQVKVLFFSPQTFTQLAISESANYWFVAGHMISVLVNVNNIKDYVKKCFKSLVCLCLTFLCQYLFILLYFNLDLTYVLSESFIS